MNRNCRGSRAQGARTKSGAFSMNRKVGRAVPSPPGIASRCLCDFRVNGMRSILALILILSGCVELAPAFNGQVAEGPRVQEPKSAGAGAVSLLDDSAPVPVPEPTEKAIRFYRSGNVLWCIRSFWELLVPALILFTGFSARIRDRAERTGRKWFFVVLLYGFSFLAVKYLLDFPLNCYQGFFRQHAYGLSNQSFGRWLGNSLKRLAVDMTGYAALLWVPYLLMRKSPRRWWLYAWMATTVVAVFMVLITPVWVDPLFNRFDGLKDKALEADILALAQRAGIEGSRVYQVDKSADTKTVNAYVTGFANTKRVVLWDTLIARLDRRELLTVMGHEMGHYVLRHVGQGLLLGSALSFFGLYFLFRTSGWLIDRFSNLFRLDRVSDIASWPLILLFFGVGNFVLSPFILAYSRHQEHEADRFALEITRDNHAAATAEVKLQIENLGVPRPGLMYKLWRASHPPAGERIDFANTYKPWQKGRALKYGHLFRPVTANNVEKRP
ncbi:MAG: peptidase M48 [Verrucomicrobia bacterium]|nr:MAG: peptidase M48 [Verrucomicrobiota bacterium]